MLPQETLPRVSIATGTNGSAARLSMTQKSARSTSPAAWSPTPTGYPGRGARGGQSEDDRQQCQSDRDRAGDIDTGAACRHAFLEDARSQSENGGGDDDVDEERPSPAQQVGQDTAQDGAGREPRRHERSVESEGPFALGTFWK